MACFLVSAAEAVVVTVAAKVVEKKEKAEIVPVKRDGKAPVKVESDDIQISWSRKLKWLSWMLWGGAFLLMFEHVWHGEVVPFFPFLTAMSSASDTAAMLHEMSTIGVTMAVFVTITWAVMVVVVDMIAHRKPAKKQQAA